MSSAGLSHNTSPMSAATQESKVCRDHSERADRILATCRRMTSLKVPNLLRLYLNPWVTQTCVVLSEIIRLQWPSLAYCDHFPTFLANSGEEALSGAVKLARFTARTAGEYIGRSCRDERFMASSYSR